MFSLRSPRLPSAFSAFLFPFLDFGKALDFLLPTAPLSCYTDIPVCKRNDILAAGRVPAGERHRANPRPARPLFQLTIASLIPSDQAFFMKGGGGAGEQGSRGAGEMRGAPTDNASQRQGNRGQNSCTPAPLPPCSPALPPPPPETT
ncbi:exported protein of unknown function [Candidatus Promineifilum breve]|uniref:Uncharacterized protein n=1 Tax=Candidatus Promineifilum breve TaxID=1806508 RepID=A0A160T5Q0_9CHLR|nr:exported protein of unknown function [Candidatus Promineifilum breve]